MLGALLKKELQDLIRQPRSLVAAILYPALVLPLLAGVLAPQAADQACIEIAGNPSAIMTQRLQKSTGLADCEAKAVNRLAVTVEGATAQIDATAWRGDEASLRDAHMAISQVIALTIADQEGINPDIAQSMATGASVTDDSEDANGIGIVGLFPVLILFMAALGCTYPALESGVGEKETGTLLGLFQAPISDTEIIAAKFLAIWVCSGIAVFGGFAAALGLMRFAGEATVVFDAADAGLALLYAIMAAMPLAAAAILLSFVSQSLREAQQYLMVLVCVAVLSAGLALVTGDAPWGIHIPIANAAGGIAGVFSEKTAVGAGNMVPAIVAANAVLALCLLALAVAQLKRLRQSL